MGCRNCIANGGGTGTGPAVRSELEKQAKFQRLLPHKSQLIIFMATPGREPTPPTEAKSRRLASLLFPGLGIIKNYGQRFGSLETKRNQPRKKKEKTKQNTVRH